MGDWRIRTHRITHDTTGRIAVVIAHRTRDGRVFHLPRPPDPEHGPDRAQTVCCPRCHADHGHTLTGTWGHDALLTCVDGHAWTPRLPGLTPADLLREAVRLSLGPARLTYREARTDPDATPPTPHHTALAHPLDTAATDLNHRTWTPTTAETHIAADLLRRTDPRPDGTTDPGEVTEAARLGRLRLAVTALGEYTALTGGRLGLLLATCHAVLAPAAGLRERDLEPGPTPGHPPALADAEGALLGLRVVLRAVATGDVDW